MKLLKSSLLISISYPTLTLIVPIFLFTGEVSIISAISRIEYLWLIEEEKQVFYLF
jgi:hypothetical protein